VAARRSGQRGVLAFGDPAVEAVAAIVAADTQSTVQAGLLAGVDPGPPAAVVEFGGAGLDAQQGRAVAHVDPVATGRGETDTAVRRLQRDVGGLFGVEDAQRQRAGIDADGDLAVVDGDEFELAAAADAVGRRADPDLGPAVAVGRQRGAGADRPVRRRRFARRVAVDAEFDAVFQMRDATDAGRRIGQRQRACQAGKEGGQEMEGAGHRGLLGKRVSPN